MNPVVVSVFSCEVIFVYGEVWGRVQKVFKEDVTDVIEVEYNVRCEKKLGHMFSKWPGPKDPYPAENSKSTCVVSEKSENKCPVYFVLDFGGRTFAAVKCCLKKVNRRIRGRRPSCGILAASPKLYKLLVSCDQGLLFFYMMYKERHTINLVSPLTDEISIR